MREMSTHICIKSLFKDHLKPYLFFFFGIRNNSINFLQFYIMNSMKIYENVVLSAIQIQYQITFWDPYVNELFKYDMNY